ncbi:MAG: hypothetical protein IJM92_14865 [Fibrobacter sp.]|uniref:hypothetical protein n=1 Tax=Fibrobacter sp. TaxID=35828 RepID=UPI0025BDA23C|nr:hypothetical protein [Fibrobacter sp.]MBQ7080902.1 hypothetical protein [Fibrobacter sp.]
MKKVLEKISDLKKIHVITIENGNPQNDLNIDELRVPQRNWERISKYCVRKNNLSFFPFIIRILLLIKRFLMLPIWPVFSLTTCLHFFKTASLLIKEKSITHVIAVCYPGESLIAMALLKIRFRKRIKTIMYPLDVTLGGKYAGFWIEKKLSKLFSPLFYKFCSLFADKIIVLENAKDLYIQKLYTHKHKFAICGIPLIENVPTKHFSSNKEVGIQLLYGGNIIPSIRNPDYLFCLLNEIAHNKNLSITINIYGAVSEELLKKYISKYNSVSFNYHGWVTENDLTEAINKADALISVGNNVEHLIPSKIFKYMSLKKPIIHLCFIDDDPCLPYLKKYGHTFFVKKGIDINVDDFSSWLRSLDSYEISLDCEKMFPQCTPAYTANVIQLC